MTEATATSPASQRTNSARQAMITLLLLTATASRLIPHAPNFTAVPAMALLGGTLFRRTWLAFAVPLMAMAIGDLVLGVSLYGAAAAKWIVPVYACIALTAAIGRFTQRNAAGIAVGGTAATLAFFLITNACVWLFGGFYPTTPNGLLTCYAAALPFAANMWLSTMAYGLGLLLVWHHVERRLPQLVTAQ